MRYKKLSTTDLNVSLICLGTMTWGEQNTEKEGHEQLDYAIDQGINFIDTAEMYSVPGSKETQGSTERIIGTWLNERKNRDKVTIATKVTGPSKGLSYLRGGPNFSREHILEAIEGNLKRLQTDYIDIYQLHWPERKANFFGKLDYKHDENDPWVDNIQDILRTMKDLVDQGKIRYVGISNETPWGTHRYLTESTLHDLPRIVTVQNPYSLLNRSYEVGMAEMSIRENVELLAYSPLAFGVLSGKYLGGTMPHGSRLDKFPVFSRYSNDLAMEATARYKKISDDAGVSLAKMALAFVNQQPFLGANIIGATKMEQLKENIASIDVALSSDTLEAINEVHKAIMNPAP